MAEFTQRQLEQLGIRVPVVENTFPRMMAKQDSGAFQIASGSGWGADYPDPENFFFLFYSKNIPPAGKNASRYRNPGFDALFDRMATMDPGPERLGIIHQMNAMLNEDCPNVLEFHRANYVMVQPFAPRSHNNMMLEGGFKYSTLDYGLREAKRREWNRRPMWPMALLGAVMVAGVVYGVRVNRRRVV